MDSTCRYCGKFKDDGTFHSLANHYKTAFHKFNYERKNFMLPPMSEEEFEIYWAKMGTSPKDGSNQNENYCEVCKKEFSSKKAYLAHVKTKKHIKQQTRLNNRPTQEVEKSDHSSDYEDVDNNSAEELKTVCCLVCSYQTRIIGMKKHLLEKHIDIFPNFFVKMHLVEKFIDFCSTYVYSWFTCLSCSKAFNHIENLLGHVRDKSHVYPSENFIDQFLEKISSDVDSSVIDELKRLRDGPHYSVENESLGLMTSKNDKIIAHRSLMPKSSFSDKFYIIPELRMGLKQLNELSRIPVSYETIRETVDDSDMPGSVLKKMVLYELSRRACGSVEKSLQDRIHDKDKSAAIRQIQKLDVDKGLKMNKVQRPLPKKLMYL